MKAVADTNVLVSGLLWSGPCASLLDRGAARLIGLVTSAEILTELEGVLARPHLVEPLRLRGRTVAGVMKRYRSVAQIVEPVQVEVSAALRDPKDLHVLRCAVGANVDAIVTGDKDLLVLKEFLEQFFLDAGAHAIAEEGTIRHHHGGTGGKHCLVPSETGHPHARQDLLIRRGFLGSRSARQRSRCCEFRSGDALDVGVQPA